MTGMPIDELVLLDIDPRAPRDRRRPGPADARPARLDRPATLHRRPRRGHRRRRLRPDPAPRRRPGRRLVDETLPPTFGVVGQETTGAGGFAKALRTVPLVLELAELTARRGAPGAWIVDFTNPVGIVSQALLDAGHRAIGLCNVAIGFQRGLAERFGVSPERVELEHVGLNHLSWERAVRVDGVDRLPELIDGDAEALASIGRRPGSIWSGPLRRDPVVLPALLLPDPPGRRRAARRPYPRAGGHRHRARAPRHVPGPGPGREAGPARDAAAAPTTARPPPS